MRIPLRAGKTTPEFIDNILGVFGQNPHGEPLYRLIWSERKLLYFMGEVAPEYLYLDPCWLLEVWIPAEKAAGPRSQWNDIVEKINGEYPSEGVYFFSLNFDRDWEPSEENVRMLAKGIEMSRDIPIEQRAAAIRENLEETARLKREEVADTIVESLDSAAMGRIQQGASGKKNNFRTPEDFERDQERIGRVSHKDYARLPKAGGKLIN